MIKKPVYNKHGKLVGFELYQLNGNSHLVYMGYSND